MHCTDLGVSLDGDELAVAQSGPALYRSWLLDQQRNPEVAPVVPEIETTILNKLSLLCQRCDLNSRAVSVHTGRYRTLTC